MHYIGIYPYALGSAPRGLFTLFYTYLAQIPLRL